MKFKPILQIIGTIVVIVAVSACEQVNSKDVKTTGIYGDFTVTGTTSTSAEVVATLVVGGASSNTYVDLSDSSDYIEATALGESRKLTRDASGLGTIKYKTTFTNTQFANTDATFVINFHRTENESAPNSTVTLPKALSTTISIINGNTDGTLDIAAGEDLQITGTQPSTGTFTYSITGSCIDSISGSLDLTSGSVTIADTKFSKKKSTSSSSCDLNIAITNQTTGTVDPIFSNNEGGKITATQSITNTAYKIQFAN